MDHAVLLIDVGDGDMGLGLVAFGVRDGQVLTLAGEEQRLA
jgi:hypothetical protein